jgi:CheY-like chemotaxis protein
LKWNSLYMVVCPTHECETHQEQVSLNTLFSGRMARFTELNISHARLTCTFTKPESRWVPVTPIPDCVKPKYVCMKNFHEKQTTILWADDDLDELALLHEVLGEIENPYKIIEANNGKNVMDYLEHAKQTGTFPCLIVLDLNMPVLSGKETLVRIKQEPAFENIPVVVLTTSSSPQDRSFCESYDTEMLTKPITFAALKQIVQNLLRMCDASVKH